jgi:hypothetical protein
MTSVTQFAQHLLRLDPHKSPGRLAFFNYLKHILDPSEPFTPSVVNDFYARTLNFDYWQTNAQSLSQDVRDDLANYIRQTKLDEPEWKNIRHADETQVITLKMASDWETILSQAESSRRKSGDKLKLVRISEQEVLSLFMTSVGTLEVKLFAPKAMVVGNRLLPLAPLGHLHYSANMELMPHVRQILQGSLMTTISFYRDENGLNGLVSRGHTFQKFETFVRARNNDNHDLFNCLKRLERHFINPQSDPYYQDLVNALERANRALQSPNARALNLQMAEKTLQKGSLALRNAFPNDRLLQLLVTHLDHGIRQARSSLNPNNAQTSRSAE